jgi:ketosteroid isomerase-like protein
MMSGMSNDQSADVVERLYAALDAGDVAAFLELCAGDAVFQYPAEGLLPYGGTWRGREGIGEFLELHDQAEEILRFEPADMLTEGATTLVLGFFEGRTKPGRHVWSTSFVHALAITGSQLQRWEAFFDSAVAVEAHRSSGGNGA